MRGETSPEVGRKGLPLMRHVKTEAGAALVELAISLPLLAIILVGTIDFGRAFRTAMIVTNAARAGAQWGARTQSSAADLTGMQTKATDVLGLNGLTAASPPAAARWCECATDGGTFSSVLCTSTTTCPSGQHLVISVSVTATSTFSMISPFPGLPASVTISRGARMRVAP